jgi:cytolysin-activating lysine-acyltransferase
MKNGADPQRKVPRTSGPSKSGAAAPNATPTAASKQTAQARFAQSFTSIVSVLMRDTNFKKLRLADLEKLVIPAIMTGQWRLAHSRVAPTAGAGGDQKVRIVPAAVAIWARVSEAVDKRLSETLDSPLALRPDEWTSGDIIWLIAIAGDPRVAPQFIKQLDATVFDGKQVKMRQRGADGAPVVTSSLRVKRTEPPTAA